ncbi:MAG: hypothetical protein WC564_00115 [Patescibacteria group bacterium]|jgi:hypothetical protein
MGEKMGFGQFNAQEKKVVAQHQESLGSELTDMSWYKASDKQILTRDRIKAGIEASRPKNKVNFIGPIVSDAKVRYLNVGLEGKKNLTRVVLDDDDNVINLIEI